MTKLEEVEIKLEAARQHLALSKETRDRLQEKADQEENLAIKDILTVGVLHMNTIISEQESEIAEADIMLLNYKARLAALQQ